MQIDNDISVLEKTKVNLETSQIPWTELQRFFAAGVVIAVADNLDLVETACQFAADNKQQVSEWLSSGQIAHVSDQQAQDWFNLQQQMWAVVVKPWVLVQCVNSAAQSNHPT